MIIRAAMSPTAAAPANASSASSATIATGTLRCGSDAGRAAGVTPGEAAGLACESGGRRARWRPAAPLAGRVTDRVECPSVVRT
jgi:hypothetical protein